MCVFVNPLTRRSLTYPLMVTIETQVERTPVRRYNYAAQLRPRGDNLLQIEKRHIDDMTAHALEDDPDECCGILAGKGETISRLYRITNTARSPTRYLMDPKEQLSADRDADLHADEFLAFYHSHTHSPAYPSQTDVRMAVDSGWLEVYYLLISLEDKSSPQVRAFHITASGEIVEEDYKVI